VTAVFTSQRTARKSHRCELCDDLIKPGEPYMMQVAAPGHPELDNARWLRSRFHLGDICYRYQSEPEKPDE
jgi:hypothetical protein